MTKKKEQPAPAVAAYARAGDVVDEIKDRLAPGQRAGLEIVFEAFDASSEEYELGTMLKVISVGLFVLGLDRAGSFCLSELTEALHGERADEVYNQIADAGNTANDARTDVEYDERRRIFAKAEEAGA